MIYKFEKYIKILEKNYLFKLRGGVIIKLCPNCGGVMTFKLDPRIIQCEDCGYFEKEENDDKDWLGRPKKKKKSFFGW